MIEGVYMNKRVSEAKTLMQLHAYDHALALLMPLFTKERDVDIVYLIGQCFYEKLDISNAVRFFKKALEYAPENEHILYDLGRAYQEFDRPLEALEIYRKILELKELR